MLIITTLLNTKNRRRLHAKRNREGGRRDARTSGRIVNIGLLSRHRLHRDYGSSRYIIAPDRLSADVLSYVHRSHRHYTTTKKTRQRTQYTNFKLKCTWAYVP